MTERERAELLTSVSQQCGESPYLVSNLVEGEGWCIYEHETHEMIDTDLSTYERDTCIGTLCAGFEIVRLSMETPSPDGMNAIVYVWALDN